MSRYLKNLYRSKKDPEDSRPSAVLPSSNYTSHVQSSSSHAESASSFKSEHPTVEDPSGVMKDSASQQSVNVMKKRVNLLDCRPVMGQDEASEDEDSEAEEDERGADADDEYSNKEEEDEEVEENAGGKGDEEVERMVEKAVQTVVRDVDLDELCMFGRSYNSGRFFNLRCLGYLGTYLPVHLGKWHVGRYRYLPRTV